MRSPLVQSTTTSQHAPTPDLAYTTRTSVRYEYDDDYMYMTRHDCLHALYECTTYSPSHSHMQLLVQ